ncbi:hypothetical protein [Streptomyces sp. NPDC048361]|uniref:hypothetical protein n=1 Tax=Streptomyces sp. NPDC048361 TaxID=3154720 RepID=UPI003449511F
MEAQTYDPVLRSEDLPKWRLTSPVRPPDPGRALVLVRDSGPSLTVRSGEEIPSSRFGAYSGMYTIDMAEHRLLLDIPLLSRDPTFSFRSRVDLVCRVADPAKVVSRGIRDMSGALYGYLRKSLRSVARDYDIAEFHQAEQALNAALAGFTGDDAIRLRNIQVELLVDEDEIIGSGREFRDVERETRLAGMRRRRHLDMIREEGVDGLIAEIMEREGPRAALAWIEKGEAEKREVRREVMRMVLERGDADREPFEQAELERAVLDEVLREGDGLFEKATRSGRLRGTLARALETDAADDDRVPLKGEVLREEGASRRARADRGPGMSGAAAPAGPGSPRRESRSGSSPAPAGPPAPPEDEPLPGVADRRARVVDEHWPAASGPSAGSGPRSGSAAAPPRSSAGGEAAAPTGRAEGGSSPAAAPRISRVRGTAKRGTPGKDGQR